MSSSSKSLRFLILSIVDESMLLKTVSAIETSCKNFPILIWKKFEKIYKNFGKKFKKK
jgi:hypothetical protein